MQGPVSRVVLSAGLAADLKAWARAAHPEECCGLLFGENGQVESAELTENVASDRCTTFEIDPARLLAAHRQAREGGRGLAGYFHSHPNGKAVPSKTDAEMALPDGRIWLIVAGEEITAWRTVDEESALHGRFAQLELHFADSGLVMTGEDRH